MRFISGIIIGIVLTIGTAYVHDMLFAPASATSNAARPMVNWDAVGAAAHKAVEKARMQWDRLSAR
jgi:hypothetical protein